MHEAQEIYCNESTACHSLSSNFTTASTTSSASCITETTTTTTVASETVACNSNMITTSPTASSSTSSSSTNNETPSISSNADEDSESAPESAIITLDSPNINSASSATTPEKPPRRATASTASSLDDGEPLSTSTALAISATVVATSAISSDVNTSPSSSSTMTSPTTTNSSSSNISCSYCALTFSTRADLRAHCQTEAHQNIIMSDEGRDWKWRPPPRGYTVDSYSLCESYVENAVCHYGNQCVDAHGGEELHEWKERFEYRKMRVQRACEKELYGKSYTEELLDKLMVAPTPDKIMREKVDGVEESCSNELITTVSSKVSKRDWTFVLKTRRMLKAVALLQDAHRNHFTLKRVCPAEMRAQRAGKTVGETSDSKSTETELTSDQEWVVHNFEAGNGDMLEHRVTVGFSTDIYGTFRQTVVFDFGVEPALIRHLCVDVIPVTDIDKIQEIKKEMVVSSAQRWDESIAAIIPFVSSMNIHLPSTQQQTDDEREKELMQRYPCPRASTFTLTQSTITEKRLTSNNYRSRIHELLYVEEIARYDQVARYNLTTKLRITSTYLLAPSGMATSTAKYAHSGELFALMTLGKDISEDTSAGRLILNNCTSVYISNVNTAASDTEKRTVYEALIEDKGKTMIYLKLSAKTVSDLSLVADTDFQADIQFQLNRLSYCEWHHAIDKIADFKIIFPETFFEPSIPWTPRKQWSDQLDPKLNSKQKEAVLAITTPTNVALPPILLIGPFGTGKTFTLASSIKQLLLQPETRILICTHSNSAADLYIKDYLHSWVEEGNEEAKPLRVYYHKRWVATVNTTVQKYCLIEMAGNIRVFRRPSKEDIMKYRIVVVTLNISMELAALDLPKGFFTHIFLDEAAQAMECEAIMPLALATDNTRIVLAGDHMQMSPELFSNFAKERRLHISLLERLYDHYPVDFPCKILLCENYRAHEAIIKFTSELFYDQKLIASGKQPRHDKFYPLTFFTTRGEDVQDKNSTAFYNNSEVYEVVERVHDLKKQWPASWGKITDQSIGIMTPYADQVFRIRSELRKRRMGGISVERVLNVQGKQFRAIFLSTVRTRRTCPASNNVNTGQPDDMDYGFLSNSKLLNTAITRAQSLVAVVGDPVALCSIGRCRKVWERFIEICDLNKSLFGITWSSLRSQLDGVELKKTFVLNPLAPEFVPRAHQAEAYLREQQLHAQQQTQQPQQPPHTQNHPQPLHPTPHHHAQNPVVPHHIQPPHVGFPPQPMMNQPIRVMGNGPHMPNPYAGPASQQQPYPYIFYQNQQQQLMRAPPISQPPQNFPANNQPPNLWGPPHFNNANNHWPKLNQHPLRPPQQQPLNVNMPPGRSHQPMPALRSPGSQHLHHNQLPYLQNNIQNNKPLQLFIGHGANAAPNHIRNVGGAPISPAPLGPTSMQQSFSQTLSSEHNVSPLTYELMASIAARANQVHQQNAFNMQSTKGVRPASMDMQMQLQHHHHQPHPAHPHPTGQQPPQQPSQQPPQQQPHQTHLHNSGNATNSMNLDKDLQFLQNVHMPHHQGQHQPPQQSLQYHMQSQSQKQAPPSNIQHHHPQLTSSISMDISYLLPPNMSFYDMALESSEFQFKWFVKLVESHGLETANKYRDLLGQVSNAMEPISSKPLAAATTAPNPSNLNSNLDIFDNLLSGNVPTISDLLGSKELTDPLPTSFPTLLSTNRTSDRLQASTVAAADIAAPNIPNHFSVDEAHQSIPLYRRQAGASNNSHPPHHLQFDSGHSGQGGSGGIRHPTTTSQTVVSDADSNNMFENIFNHNGMNMNLNENQQSFFHGLQMQNLANVNSQPHNLFSRGLSGLLQSTSQQNTQQQQHQHQQHQQQQQLHQSQQQSHHPTSQHQHDTNSSATTYASVLLQGTNQQQQQQQQLPTTSPNFSVFPRSGPSQFDDMDERNAEKKLQQQQNQSNASNQNHVINKHSNSGDDKDPFAAIRELGQRSNGLYNYFQ